MPETSPLQAIYQGLSQKNPQLKEYGYDNFAKDMQDETKLQGVYEGLASKNPALKEVGFDKFKTDMYGNPVTEVPEMPQQQQVQPQSGYQPEINTASQDTSRPTIDPQQVSFKDTQPKQQEPGKMDGFWKEQGIRGHRSALELNKMLTNAPDFLNRLAVETFNISPAGQAIEGIGNLLGKEWKMAAADLRPEKVNETIEQQKQQLTKKISALNPKHEQGILESAQKGDWATFTRNLAGGVSDSFAPSLAMMVSGGAMTAPGMIGSSSLVFGAGKYAEMDENNPDMPESTKVLAAAINGSFEGIFETYLGSGAMGKAFKGIITRQGKDAAKNGIKKGIIEGWSDILMKHPALAPAGEGIEEFGTQIAQNIVDKFSGYRPDINIMEGAGDALLIGMASGAVHSAPLQVAQSIVGSGQQPTVQPEQQPLTVDPRQTFEAQVRQDAGQIADNNGNITTIQGFDGNQYYVKDVIPSPKGTMYMVHNPEGGKPIPMSGEKINGKPVTIPQDQYIQNFIQQFDQKQQVSDEIGQAIVEYNGQPYIDLGESELGHGLQPVEKDEHGQWVESNIEPTIVPEEEFQQFTQQQQAQQAVDEVTQEQAAETGEAPKQRVVNTIIIGKTQYNVTQEENGAFNFILDDNIDPVKAEKEIRNTMPKGEENRVQVVKEQRTTPAPYPWLEPTTEMVTTGITILPKNVAPVVDNSVKNLTPEKEIVAENKNISEKETEKLTETDNNLTPVEEKVPKTEQENIEIQSTKDLVEPKSSQKEKPTFEGDLQKEKLSETENEISSQKVEPEQEIISETSLGTQAVTDSNGEDINSSPVAVEAPASNFLDDKISKEQPGVENVEVQPELENEITSAGYTVGRIGELYSIKEGQNSILATGNTLEEAWSKAKEIVGTLTNETTKPEQVESKGETPTENIQVEEAKVNITPSEAQKEAGNYQKGHVTIQGMDITIEQPKGSVRTGKDATGKKWKVTMNNTYGYFKRTQGKDGDQIDVFMGDNLESDKVFIVDQVNIKNGIFDEVKVMLGFNNITDAANAYLSNYEKGWGGMGNISETNIDLFKDWLKNGNTKQSFKTGTAWTEVYPGISNMVTNEREMPKPEQQKVQVLRGEGNNGVRGMEQQLSEIPEGRREKTEPQNDTGQERSEQGVQQGELSLDNVEKAVTEQEKRTNDKVSGKDKMPKRVGGRTQPKLQDSSNKNTDIQLESGEGVSNSNRLTENNIEDDNIQRSNPTNGRLGKENKNEPDNPKKQDINDGVERGESNRNTSKAKQITFTAPDGQTYTGEVIETLPDDKLKVKTKDGTIYRIKQPTQPKFLDDVLKQKKEPVVKENLTTEKEVSEIGKIFSSSSRFKPTETITFDQPIVGPSGAKLISYEWKYTWSIKDGKDEGTIDVRVSDWTQAEQSADTGRDIVHQFTVEMPDGTKQTVSSESALNLLGVTEKTPMKNFPSLVNAVKTLAKQQLQLAVLNDKLKTAKEIEAVIDKMAMPPIERIEEQRGAGDITWKMGDAFVAGNSKEYDYNTRKEVEVKEIPEERKGALIDAWRTNRKKELSVENAFSQSTEGINLKIRELQDRIKRQEKKVNEISTKEDGSLEEQGEGKEPEIRFRAVETDQNLVALHNLSAASIRNIDKIGGLPVPSLAVTRTDIGFTSFGDISLIANKDLIDPSKNRDAKTFNTDIYSPRYPVVSYELDLPVYNETFKEANQKAKEYDLTYVDSNSIESDGVKSILNSDAAKVAFLMATGKRLPKVAMKKPKFDSSFNDFIGRPTHELINDPAFVEKVTEHYRQIDEQLDRGSRSFVVDGKVNENLLRNMASDVMQAKKEPTPDRYANSDAVRERTEKHRAAFEKWANETMKSITKRERIFDGFTYSGNRKYLPHDIETVIRILKKGLQDGEGFNYGVGNIRAVASKKYSNVKQMQQDRDKIIPPADMKKIKTQMSDKLMDLMETLRPFYKYDSSSFGYLDAASRSIAEFAKNRQLEDYKNVTPEIKDQIAEFVAELRDLPTEYFESKIRRAVGLNEFAGAVVPKGTHKDVIDILKQNGIKVKYYEKGNNEARKQAVEELSKANDLLFRKASPIYSPTQRALEQIKQEKGTPEQFKAMLLKNGAKQAELDWMEFDERFPDTGKSITKAEVQEWIDGNKVEIEEVEKEGEKKTLTRSEALRELDRGNSVYNEYGGEIKTLKDLDDFNEYYVRRGVNPTKYSQYQLPGGSNYKEVLLTMPSKSKEWEVFDPKTGNVVASFNTEQEAEAEADRRGPAFDYGERDVTDNPNQFRSSHWSEVNIIAHTRIKEYTDTEGRRLLHIEEIQSDWAQKGKKEGFKNKDFVWDSELGKRAVKAIKEENNFGFNSWQEAAKAIEKDADFYNTYDPKYENMRTLVEWRDAVVQERKVPDMPFKQTPQWVNLVLRKLTSYAAENGYEGISWTPGEKQAERYDLSKQVDTVEYFKDGDSYFVSATKDYDRYTVGEFTEKTLPDAVGKEVAEKIIKGEGQELKDPDGAPVQEDVVTKELSGVDLKVGGEGMIGFYDKIVPSQVNKIFGKFGTKVQTTKINAGNDINENTGEYVPDNQLEVQYFPITEKLFNTAMSEGFPMFQASTGNFLPDAIKSNNLKKYFNKLFANAKNAGTVHVVSSINEIPENFRLKASEMTGAQGFYMPGTGETYLITGNIKNAADAFKTWVHEVGVHRGLSNIIPAHLLNPMFEKFYDDLGADVIQANIPASYHDKSKAEQAEEYMAYLGEKITNEQDISTKEKGFWTQLVESVKNILNKLFTGVKFTQADAERIVKAAVQSVYQPPTKPKGRKQNFENWFSDSKIVNKKGNPLVVYHGTDAKFNEFQESYSGQSTGAAFLGRGFYFSDSETDASNYGKNIMPVYLSIKKPYDFDNGDLVKDFPELSKKDGTKFSDILEDRKNAQKVENVEVQDDTNGFKMVYWELDGKIKGQRVSPLELQDDPTGKTKAVSLSRKYSEPLPRDISTEALRGAMIKQGYDGAISSGTNFWDKGKEYVAFEPTQIKSATGNTGTFDANNPDIRFKVIGEQGAANLDKTYDVNERLNNLSLAKEMERRGKSPKEILLSTGWQRGNDNKFKYETPDLEPKIDIQELRELPKQPDGYSKEIPLIELVEDSELFKAYSQLRETKVVFYETNLFSEQGGFADSKKNVIGIGTSRPEAGQVQERRNLRGEIIRKRPDKAYDNTTLKSLLSHEVQHLIQQIEGFARGGNVDKLWDYLVESEIKQLEKDPAMAGLDDTRKRAFAETNVEEEYGSKIHAYNRLAGEIESQTVQDRLNLTPEERRNRLLSEESEISKDDQIYLYNSLYPEQAIIGERGVVNLDKAQEATVRMGNLGIARQMETAGKEPKEIRLATGWERGADKKWRYEISDNIKIVNLPKIESNGVSKPVNFSEVFNDEELFEAYPEIKDYKVILVSDPDGKITGDFIPEAKIFKFNIDAIQEANRKRGNDRTDDMEGDIIHEVQHAIQVIEQFQPGTNTNDALRVYADNFIQGKRKGEILGGQQIEKAIRENLKADVGATTDDEAIYKNYLRATGEVEARNAVTRRTLTPEQKRQTLLRDTEDVAREDQLFLREALGGQNNEIRFRAADLKTGNESFLDDRLEAIRMINIAEKTHAQTPKIKITKKEKIDLLREFYIDQSLPIRRWEENVMKRGGKKNDTSKPYRDIRLSFGRMETLFNEFHDGKIQPIINAESKIIKSGVSEGKILPYIIAKSGMERNHVMREEKLQEWIKKHPEATQEDITDQDNKLWKEDFAGVKPLLPEDTREVDAISESIIKGFEALAKPEDVAELWRTINQATYHILDVWKDGGQLSEKQYDFYRNRMQYFVPLRGWKDGAAKYLRYHPSRGSGASLRKAEGRRTIADNPIAFIQTVGFKAIGEQVDNEVKNAALNLMLRNYGGDFKDLHSFKKAYFVKETVIDEQGNKEEAWVLYRDEEGNPAKPPEELFASGEARAEIFDEHEKLRAYHHARENEVVVKRNGQPLIMIFPDKYLSVSQALKRQNTMFQFFRTIYDSSIVGENVFFNSLAYATNFMKGMMTSYNPVFPLMNINRDQPEAAITRWIRFNARISDMALKHTPVAVGAIVRRMRGQFDLNNKTDMMAQDFYRFGGTTGFTHEKSPEQVAEELKKKLRRVVRQGTLRGKTLDKLTLVLDGIRAWNMLFEDSTRLAVYIAAIEKGMTPKDAAFESRNASTDFNMKGKGTKMIEALFAFFKAAINSLEKNMQLAKINPKKFATASAVYATMGFLEAMLNDMGDDDEDDYYNINPFVRHNYLVFRQPWGKKEKYLRLPLPQFWRGFKSFGANVYDVYRGKTSVAKAAGLSFTNFVAGLAPIDVTGFISDGKWDWTPVVPTPAKPLYEAFVSNKDFMGNDIARTAFTKTLERQLSNSSLNKKNVNPAIKLITDMMYKATSGEGKYQFKMKNGKIVYPTIIDMNPSKIEHLITGYTGGVGRFASDAITTIYQGLSSEEDVDLNNTPFVNSFVRNIPDEKWGVMREWQEIQILLEDYSALKSDAERELSEEKLKELYGSNYPRVEAIFKSGDARIDMLVTAFGFDNEEAGQQITDIMKESIEEINKTKP